MPRGRWAEEPQVPDEQLGQMSMADDYRGPTPDEVLSYSEPAAGAQQAPLQRSCRPQLRLCYGSAACLRDAARPPPLPHPLLSI